MIRTDILIIGAGAAGLAAAYELSLVNKKIIVVEARDRIGGRIHSVTDNRFKQIVEKGKPKKSKDFIVGWDQLIKKLKALEIDMPISNFLHTHFPGEENKELRDSV